MGLRGTVLRNMIFILNDQLSLQFNMVSELGLAGGPGFESSPCNLILICLFESP